MGKWKKNKYKEENSVKGLFHWQIGGNIMNEHKVWTILNKESFAEDYIEKMEHIFDFLSEIKDKIGESDLNKLYGLLCEYRETFKILGELLNNDSMK